MGGKEKRMESSVAKEGRQKGVVSFAEVLWMVCCMG
jgi:hypothetical protein